MFVWGSVRISSIRSAGPLPSTAQAFTTRTPRSQECAGLAYGMSKRWSSSRPSRLEAWERLAVSNQVLASARNLRRRPLVVREEATLNASPLTTVVGWAWKADDSPLAYARLRLRDVVSGYLEASTTADEAGEFVFGPLEGGTYVIEVVNERDRVLALGQVFSLIPGDTASTFLKLPAPDSGRLPQFFRNTSAGVISAAAESGIPGLVQTGDPVSAER